MGFFITAGILILIGLLPVGGCIHYDAAGFTAKIVAGPVVIPLFPKKAKANKTKNPPKPKQKKKAAAAASVAAAPEPPKKGGSILRFQGIVKEGLSFLNAFRKKLLLRRLELKVILAGDDPSDLAYNYGRAWAALGNLLPALERVFTIKKRDLNVECDFCAAETSIYAHLDIVVRVGALLWLVILYGVRIVLEFLKLKKLEKGGNVL